MYIEQSFSAQSEKYKNKTIFYTKKNTIYFFSCLKYKWETACTHIL